MTAVVPADYLTTYSTLNRWYNNIPRDTRQVNLLCGDRGVTWRAWFIEHKRFHVMRYIFFQLHAVSQIYQDRQRKPSAKTLRFSLSGELMYRVWVQNSKPHFYLDKYIIKCIHIIKMSLIIVWTWKIYEKIY